MSSISDAQRAALEVLAPLVDPTTDDLTCMKISAIAGRGARRDFWDLHAMLTARRQSLRDAIEAYRRKYAAEDVGHVVRSLVYFADAESEPMPVGLANEHWEKIKADFRTWVQEL